MALTSERTRPRPEKFSVCRPRSGRMHVCGDWSSGRAFRLSGRHVVLPPLHPFHDCAAEMQGCRKRSWYRTQPGTQRSLSNLSFEVGRFVISLGRQRKIWPRRALTGPGAGVQQGGLATARRTKQGDIGAFVFPDRLAIFLLRHCPPFGRRIRLTFLKSILAMMQPA